VLSRGRCWVSPIPECQIPLADPLPTAVEAEFNCEEITVIPNQLASK